MGDLEADIRRIAMGSAAVHGSTTARIVLAKLLGSRPDLRGRAAEIMYTVQHIVQQVNEMDSSELAEFKPIRKTQSKRQSLPPLPDATHGNVVLRFPPEPNGYPHIGHAKAAIINDEYAKMYGGKLVLRMDDTNPAAERLEFYAALKVGLEWLGVSFSSVKNTSDDMELLHNKAAELIHKGMAYVCECSREESSKNRQDKVYCPCSRLTPEENHTRWVRMQTKYKPGKAVLRYRGDMTSDNTTMRDPVLFRIIHDKHPLLNTRYRTWPSYDLAIAIEDSVDGITHALRSKEYEMRNVLYNSIQESLGLRKSRVMVFSRLALKDMPVSKRLIKPLLERGHISSYDDPRLPTLAGLRRRGITPQAIRKFILSLGFTKSDTIAPFETLESYNRSMIDAVSVRLHMVQDYMTFSITGTAGPAQLPDLPGSDDAKRRLDPTSGIMLNASDVSDGDMVLLMGLGTAHVDAASRHITMQSGIPHSDLPHIHWVPVSGAMQVRLLVPQPPFVDEKFDQDSLRVFTCMVEPYFASLPDYTMIQFVRFGYARKESARQAVFAHK
ncbi:MAG: glutamate--tRNA ligase [Cenarchaeum sp. SB0678_bin_8]|nr:glutamate--tRNA ligase [Cenarchaeum sp. SB0678_bin_8]